MERGCKMSKNQEQERDKDIDHFPFIEGDIIDLCARNSKHAYLYTKWKNDPVVRRYSRNVIPRTLDEQKKRSERSPERFPEHISFEIWHKEDKRPLGIIGLGHIDWVSGWANAFIFIGEKEYWNKNIATEATKLLMDYSFKELNLNKIHGGVAVKNIGSWSVAEKLGFKLEGVEKEEFYVDGEYLDHKTYCLFKEDWLNLNK
jgi:RimJ/RimL family protein N-acetyltransferase